MVHTSRIAGLQTKIAALTGKSTGMNSDIDVLQWMKLQYWLRGKDGVCAKAKENRDQTHHYLVKTCSGSSVPVLSCLRVAFIIGIGG